MDVQVAKGSPNPVSNPVPGAFPASGYLLREALPPDFQVT